MSEWQAPETSWPTQGRTRRVLVVIGLALLSIVGALVYLGYGVVQAHVSRCFEVEASVAVIVALQQRPIEELPTVGQQVDEQQAGYRRLIQVAEGVDAEAWVTEDAQEAWAALGASSAEMIGALESHRGPDLWDALALHMGRLRDRCRTTAGCDAERVQSALFADRDTSSAATIARARAGLAVVEGVDALAALRVATSTHADALEARDAARSGAYARFRAALTAVQHACRGE